MLIAAAIADGTVDIWQLDGTKKTSIAGHEASVLAVSFSPLGEAIASGSADGKFKIWRRNGRGGFYAEWKTLAGHGAAVFDVSFSPDGKLLASASGDGKFKIWRADSGKTFPAGVFGVSFMAEGEAIASALGDGTIKLWYRDGICLRTLQGHKDIVYSVRFSPDGRKLVSASRDGTIKLWVSVKISTNGRANQNKRGNSAAIPELLAILN